MTDSFDVDRFISDIAVSDATEAIIALEKITNEKMSFNDVCINFSILEISIMHKLIKILDEIENASL